MTNEVYHMRDNLNVRLTISYPYDKESLDALKKYIAKNLKIALEKDGHNYEVKYYPDSIIFRIVIGVIDNNTMLSYEDRYIAHFYIDNKIDSIVFHSIIDRKEHNDIDKYMTSILKDLPSKLVDDWCKAVELYNIINDYDTYRTLFKRKKISVDQISILPSK